MKKFIVILVLSLALIAGGMFSQASAASISSLIRNGQNTASDEDREYLIDRDYTDATAPGFGIIGQLDVGDSLRGSINFNTINSASANVGGLTGNDELSAVFQILITSKAELGAGIFLYTFGPDPAFEADLGGGMTAVPTGIVPGLGAIAMLFADSTPDYAGDFDDPAPAATPPTDNDGDMTNGPTDDGTAAPRTINPPSSADVSVGPYATEEAFVATAMDGIWFATLGFLGPDGLPGTGDEAGPGPGEGALAQTLVGSGFDNALAAFGFTSGTTGATNNLGLNVIALGPAAAGIQINRVTPSPFGGLVDFAITQNIKGVYDLDTPFEFSSNTDAAFNATIPEPATMILLGTGLLGLGIYSRRKRMK